MKKNAKISEFNEFLAEACSLRGVALIDLNGRLSYPGQDHLDERYSLGGIHLNAEGYKIWAEEIRRQPVWGGRDGT